MNKSARIAIVGGSLVGPTAELLFRRAGFTHVTTYEALRTVHPQSGGVMGLRRRSTSILRDLGLPLEEAHAFTSSVVDSFDLVHREPRFRKRDLFPGETITWSGLHDQLADRVDIHYGYRVVNVEPSGEGAIITFANGVQEEADLVIFADGRRSAGRALLDPTRPLEYNDYMVWRGLTTRVCSDVEGFRRYYDNPHGALFSVTEPTLPNQETYWEFSHNFPETIFEATVGTSPANRSFLLPQAVSHELRQLLWALAAVYLPSTLVDLVSDTQEIMGIPINDLPVPGRAAWRLGAGAAVLLGDALATVRLQAGAGLNGGLQQAESLVQKLLACENSDVALLAWQRETIEALLPWVELGRKRALRTRLGRKLPDVRPGYTVPALAPSGNAFENPKWEMA